MRTPDELRRALRKKWVSQRRGWLLGDGVWPLSLSTEPPTEAQVLAHWSGFESWLLQWREVIHAGRGLVQKETRHWRSSEQVLPYSWQFANAETVAAELGESARWTRAKLRFDQLIASHASSGCWPAELSRHFDLLADLADSEFERLCRMVDWLHDHPASGFYPRQLPIPGIDSKWLETRKRVVAAWVRALSGGAASGDFHAATGLRKPPDRLRMRLLDPALRVQLGGLSDLEAPVGDVIQLRLREIKHVLIVENLYTCLSMGDLPGTILFMGRGNAIEPFAQIPWLADVPVTYWGDLDTEGFAILNRLKGYLWHVQSLMMDEETLHAFKPLWGVDVTHAAESLSNLTATELKLYQELRSDKHGIKVRLEQERIAWDWAWSRLTAAIPAS